MSPSRRALLAAAPTLASAATLTTTPSVTVAFPAAVDPESPVDRLVLRATRAHGALMQGDLAAYRAQISTSDDFTLMAPFGGKPTRGTDLSDERWASVARFFSGGRDSTFKLVQAYRSPEIVVLVATEHTHAQVGGLPAQDWSLRVTLVFRREADQWRLVHRHADPLVAGISVQQAAVLARDRAWA